VRVGLCGGRMSGEGGSRSDRGGGGRVGSIGFVKRGEG